MIVLNLIIFEKYNAIYVSLIDAQYYDLLFQHGAHAMFHSLFPSQIIVLEEDEP